MRWGGFVRECAAQCPATSNLCGGNILVLTSCIRISSFLPRLPAYSSVDHGMLTQNVVRWQIDGAWIFSVFGDDVILWFDSITWHHPIVVMMELTDFCPSHRTKFTNVYRTRYHRIIKRTLSTISTSSTFQYPAYSVLYNLWIQTNWFYPYVRTWY